MTPIGTVKLQREQLEKLDQVLDQCAEVCAMWELLKDSLQGGGLIPEHKRPELTEMFSPALQKFLMDAAAMHEEIYGMWVRENAKEVV